MGTSKSSVQRILKGIGYHPFKVHLNQQLHGDDFENRVAFCNWMQGQLQAEPNFQSRILWSDESSFSSEGTVNRHNLHYYSVENPHWMREDHVQGR